MTSGHILGLNAFPGNSLDCLLQDGVILASAEEGRFRRVRHWARFPVGVIRYCLQAASVAVANVDHISLSQDSKAKSSRKLGYTLVKRPDLGLVLERIHNKSE